MSYEHSFNAFKPFTAPDLDATNILIALGFLVLASVYQLLLPCLAPPTFLVIVALSAQITAVAINARGYGIYQFRRHLVEGTKPDLPNCSTKSPASLVYLVGFRLSLSNPFSSSALRPEISSVPFRKQIPIAELFDQYKQTIYTSPGTSHWTVVIRGTAYELVREKRGFKAELKDTPYDSYCEVDALGIPFQLAWVEEIGSTYLTDQEIMSCGMSPDTSVSGGIL